MSREGFAVTMDFRQIESLTLDQVVQAITTAADHGLELYFTIRREPVPRHDLKRVILEEKLLKFEDGDWDVGFPASPAHLKPILGTIGARGISVSDNEFHIGAFLLLQSDRHLIEPFAQFLLPLARRLYPIIRPKLGWIDNPWRCDYDFGEIDKLRFSRLPWVTFFSPAYVAHYGEKLLRGIPAYRIASLPDGGVFVQLTRNLLASSQGEMRRVRKEVREYFAARGMKVRVCAPYYVPKALIPPGLEPVHPELHDYLRQTMRTTLVLNDGTRLKVLYIPWEQMNTTEKGVAITAIRNELYEEMKRHGEVKSWRVEINEMPAELAWMLEELARKEMVKLEWVETG